METRGRKKDPNTPYRIVLHNRKDAGKVYAATRTPRNENRKSMGFKYWGTIENGVFYPNKDFLYLSPEEQRRYLFPEGVDTSRMASVHRWSEDVETPHDARDSVKIYGPTWLLDKISEKIGLREDLVAALGSEPLADEFLTMSYFTILTELRFIDLENFQRALRFPTDTRMTEKEVTRITGRVDEECRTRFIKSRIKREMGTVETEETEAVEPSPLDVVMVDSSNYSTYSSRRLYAEYCHNKEGLPLRASGLVMGYASGAYTPVYYKEVCGNLPDARSMDEVQGEFEYFKLRPSLEIKDRGYASTKNLEDTIARGLASIMAWSTADGEALQAVKEHPVNRFGLVPGGMTFSRELGIYVHQKSDIPYTVKTEEGTFVDASNLCVNLYYDPEERASDAKEREKAIYDEKKSADALIASRTRIPAGDKEAVGARHPHLLLVFEQEGPELAAVSFRKRKGCGLDSIPEDERRKAEEVVKKGRRLNHDERDALKAELPSVTILYEKDPDEEVFVLASFRKRTGSEAPTKEEKREVKEKRDGRATFSKAQMKALERRFPNMKLTFARVAGGEAKGARPYILKSYKVKEKASNAYLTSGFVANITHGVDLTAEEAMRQYRTRDVQEKVFEMTGELFDKRLRSQTMFTTAGRNFSYFITLILFSYLRKCFESQEPGNKKFTTTRSIVTSMLGITVTEHKGRKPVISQFVGKQLDACALCGIDVPKQCRPGYSSARVK